MKHDKFDVRDHPLKIVSLGKSKYYTETEKIYDYKNMNK